LERARSRSAFLDRVHKTRRWYSTWQQVLRQRAASDKPLAEGKAIPEGIAIDAHGKPSFGLSWAALRSSWVFRN
jgi:hypothetical protein